MNIKVVWKNCHAKYVQLRSKFWNKLAVSSFLYWDIKKQWCYPNSPISFIKKVQAYMEMYIEEEYL